MPQIMLPESTEAEMVEHLQVEEDARLFGSRSDPGVEDSGELDIEDVTAHDDAEKFDHNSRFAVRDRPSTRYSPTISPSPIEQQASKDKTSRDITGIPPTPPIYAWLDDTEPPTNPDSVIKWREEEEDRRIKQQRQNVKDLEVFRNVEIVLPLKDDIPKRDAQEFAPSSDSERQTGVCMLHRNILDQYPKLDDKLAWRFATGNWQRMEELQAEELWHLNSSQNQTDADGRYGSSSSEDSDSFDLSDKVGHPFDRSGFHALPSYGFRKSRKTCSLPPPPRLIRKCLDLGYHYRGRCHLCHQKVSLRRKRDWR